MFDPWNATLDDALNESQLQKNQIPIRQFIAARGISMARASIEGKTGGNVGLAIMVCIASCARQGLVIPVWLSYEFSKRVDVVSMGKEVSWDAASALGRPYKKGAHRDAEWNKGNRAIQAWVIAQEIKNKEPATPVDVGFFEKIGEAMNPRVGKTEAENAYYRAKRMIDGSKEVTLDDIIADLVDPAKFE